MPLLPHCVVWNHLQPSRQTECFIIHTRYKVTPNVKKKKGSREARKANVVASWTL